jgi:hypothetical protein
VELFLTLLLVLHLVCVNVAAGGPILCVWLEWRGGHIARQAAEYLARMGLTTLVLGGLLGALIGGLNWTPEYRELWTGPLGYKMHWGVGELVFSLVLAAVYWLLVRRSGGESRLARGGRGLIALVHGTNLLYHFPMLFIVAGRLHDAGQTSGPAIRGAAFRALAAEGETPALAVHVALASVAMAGIMLLGLALQWQRRGRESADSTWVAAWGGRWALAASLAQLPVGLWTVAMLPAAEQSQLMGNDALATALFAVSMLAVLWLLRELVAVAMGDTARPALVRTMTAMLIVIVLMTAMQQRVRIVGRTTSHAGATAWQTRS